MKSTLKAATLLAGLTLGSQAFAANIVETANSAGTFKTLLAAAKAAGLADVLATKGHLTVFAPTDAAFAALPRERLNRCCFPRTRTSLRQS